LRLMSVSDNSNAAPSRSPWLASPFQNRGTPGWQSSSERVYLSATIFGRSRLCLLGSGSEVTLSPSSYIGRRKVRTVDSQEDLDGE